jgi:UvrD-like helicase C-terminal domain
MSTMKQKPPRWTKPPEAGEKLVALDFRTLEDDDGLPWVRIAIEPKGGGERLTRHYPAETFFAKFDFGYALTTRKSQGSEWPYVVVVGESFCWKRNGNGEEHRWLYTITRAQSKVVVVRLPWGRR